MTQQQENNKKSNKMDKNLTRCFCIMKYYLIFFKMAGFKKIRGKSMGENVEKKELSDAVGGNMN
jgi:hypothetical protein